MATELKWGVIYCPKEGSRTTRKRWKKIYACLRDSGLQFDFVQSEGAGSVERLAAMMTENGYRTILVVGGDAALNHALNGIMTTLTPQQPIPTLGVIPNGFGNDFAHYWGFDEERYKETIGRLLLRRTRKIDVGHLNIRKEDGEKTLYFLNCINVGVVAAITDLRRKAKGLNFWKAIGFFYTVLRILCKRMDFKMTFELNNESHTRRYMTVCAGSAHSYGQTPSAVPYNGQLDVTAVSHPQLLQLFEGLRLLFTGRFLRHRNIQAWRTRRLRITNSGAAPVSIDGRVVHEEIEEMEIGIRQECLDFLIP